VPPPPRPVLAAFPLDGQPYGFTHADLATLRRASESISDEPTARALRDLGERLRALLPPAPA
jgi:hypothetical protein